MASNPRSASALYEEIVKITKNEKPYFDRKSGLTEEQYFDRINKSSTLYIGNLVGSDSWGDAVPAFCTEENQLLEFFESCGEVKSVIMGLNKNKGTPCGFSFVEYFTRADAEIAKTCLNLKQLGGIQKFNEIRIDFDVGFKEGRQYGRGAHGGQVRNEVRNIRR